MTNNGHFLWNGWSKIQIFTYLWHLLCYFFENWMMKVKYPNLKIIQIPSNTILQAYFYLSGPNYFWRLNIRYPVTEVIISKIMEQASNKCRWNDHGQERWIRSGKFFCCLKTYTSSVLAVPLQKITHLEFRLTLGYKQSPWYLQSTHLMK